MDIKNHRIVLLEQVPPDERQAIMYCFYCRSCPYHGKKVKAVVAVEITTPEIEAFAPGKGISFTGICSNHAEGYPLIPHTHHLAARNGRACEYVVIAPTNPTPFVSPLNSCYQQH